ncbi:hypothetical protein GQ457_17G013640 [Hibiscus cannabinus]
MDPKMVPLKEMLSGGRPLSFKGFQHREAPLETSLGLLVWENFGPANWWSGLVHQERSFISFHDVNL